MMAAEGARLRGSLEIAIRVQTLIYGYNHINNKGWDLDKLLFSLRLTEKMNLLRDWRPEYFEESTFLTDAVASDDLESKKLWPSFCFMGLIQNRFVHKGVHFVLLMKHSHLS